MAAGAQAATLQCVEFATGVQKWSYPGLGGGGLIVADHKILILSDTGELVVGEASPAPFAPVSRAQVLGEWCWTAPPWPMAAFTAATTKAIWFVWT